MNQFEPVSLQDGSIVGRWGDSREEPSPGASRTATRIAYHDRGGTAAAQRSLRESAHNLVSITVTDGLT